MRGKTWPFQIILHFESFANLRVQHGAALHNPPSSLQRGSTVQLHSEPNRLTIPSGHKCSWITRKHGHKQCSKHVASRGQPLPWAPAPRGGPRSSYLVLMCSEQTENASADCWACCIPSIYCLSACRKVRLKKKNRKKKELNHFWVMPNTSMKQLEGK